MNVIAKIKEFANEYGLFDIPNIIVGLSGGPDSVMLLCALAKLKEQGDIRSNLYAVHVNHNLRDEADNDMNLAVDLCDSLNIPCKVFSFDVKKEAESLSRSLEETGRILRYKAFDEYSRSILGDNYLDISRIAVAHHKDDLAETMMMNLFRGAGLEGLVSPMPVTDRIIRPLLCLNKTEITDYLDANNVKYAIDKTNYENDCTRNVWRNTILPLISECSTKDASRALSDTYALLYEDLKYIEEQVNRIYEANVIRDDAVLVKSDCFISMPDAISNRIIRKLWEETFGNLTNFESTHVELAKKLFTSGNAAETTVDLSYGRKAFIANGYVGFSDSTSHVSAMCAIARKNGVIAYPDKVNIEISKLTYLPQTVFQLSAQNIENSGILEYNDLSWFLPIADDNSRAFAVGNCPLDMSFRRAGTSVSKVMKDLLSDMKVPRSAREFVLVAYNKESREVLWIPGVGHSVGFTNEQSYQKWCEDPSTLKPDMLIKLTCHTSKN